MAQGDADAALVRQPNNRKPAVAGRFYPSDPTTLVRSVRRYLDDVQHTELSAPRAVIAPHAGYVCSGVVAAASFQTLTKLPAGGYTVYLMGPTHRIPVHGVGLSGADSFETPLGSTRVATDKVSALVESGKQFRLTDDAHEPEHCLEVELPFLQTVLPDFDIVPMLFDDEAEVDQAADDLAPLLENDPYSLVAVSSDLSHYLPYDMARKVDKELLAAIAEGDSKAASRGQACGMTPILTLMSIASRLAWRAHVVAYCTSGDTCGRRDEVVGYGAVVYTK